jgi:GntR family transcriptional repressor for pyruvate dehydrogenase complex
MDRLYERIMGELLDDIVAGALPVAGRLPSVEEIAARHACGASAAREAIRALEERRVVEVLPGRGQQVRTSEQWALLDPDVLAATILRHRDPQLLREAVEALRLYEVQGALLATPRLTEGDLGQLAQTVDRMRGEQFVDAEATFHRTLMSISGNRFIAAALEFLHPTLARARRRFAPERDAAVVRLHETMLAALAERDPAAVAAAVEAYGRHLAGWLRV